MQSKNIFGHILAAITVIVWGTTFISTKVLLKDFNPVEILFFRFIAGFIALFIAYPKFLKIKNIKEEILFIGAGLTGICLYYLLENIALTYTMASNVGVIVAVSPFFTAILSHIFLKGEEHLKISFFLGFLFAITGIFIISFNGQQLSLNPKGDILAVLAALVWAIYSIITRKIGALGYNTIQTTRHTFFYGIIFMIPVVMFSDFSMDLQLIIKPVNLSNLIFLSFGASAACFVTWNCAVNILGVLKTSIYIYAIPVITIVTSVIILHEKITPMAIIGTILTLMGLLISESKIPFIKFKEKKPQL